jgi:hypothetical protein
MTEDYSFVRKYNDVYVVERWSPRTGKWKDLAAYTTAEKADRKLTEIKKNDSLKHKDPKFYKYRITVLKRAGDAI